MEEKTLEEVERDIQDIEDKELDIKPEPEDLVLEKEMELTGKEEEFLAKLRHEIRTWKASVSEYVYNTQGYIRGIQEEDDFSQEDIELFHAFLLVKDRSSYYFRTNFEKKLNKHLTKFDGKPESASYQLARILESLNPTVAESAMAA
ncbi:MAG: hypothetical protein WCT08_00305 [Patescibacteria group bacterium]|jgi:hypothetical protein